jgi:hypothetical protein
VCCVGDMTGEGRLGKNEAAKTRFSVKKLIFASGKKKRDNPNENQIYEHKWRYFVCRRGGF